MTALTLPFALTAVVGFAGLGSLLLIGRAGEAQQARAHRRRS